MKQKNEKTISKEQREDRVAFAIGVIVVMAILALIAGLVISAAVKRDKVAVAGEIEAPMEMRRGTEQTLTYTSDSLRQGDTVTWYVNEQKIAETKAEGKVATLTYTPTECGKTVVRVISGKRVQTATLEVLKPILTVSAADFTITYGDDLPDFTTVTQGFVCDDTAETIGCNFTCSAPENPDVGVWEIEYDGIEPTDYEVRYQTAHLTVLPREISIANTVTKEYDQTNTLDNPYLTLDGVLDGDQVTASCDKVYFSSKNAGYQKIMTANICLTGEDAKNYVLCQDAQGYIAPRKITLQGVTVTDKYFDGTTRAQIDNPGQLAGVLQGDSVAIGSLDVCFDSAEIGEHCAIANKVVLIGVDKDNYVVADTEIEGGEILSQKGVAKR